MTILGNELLAFESFNVFSSIRSTIKQRYQVDGTFNIVPITLEQFKRDLYCQDNLTEYFRKGIHIAYICKDITLCFFSSVPVCLVKNACSITR